MKKSTFTGFLPLVFMALTGTVIPAAANVPLPAVERPERSAPEGLVTARGNYIKRSPEAVLREVTPQGQVLHGYQSTVVYGVPCGIYRMNTDAELEFRFIDDYSANGYSLTTGWMREGRLCVMAELSFFDIADLRFLEVDPYTGYIYEDREIGLADPVTTFPNYLPAYWSSAYDPEADKVYGYTSSENGMDYAYFSAPGNDPSATVCVRTPDYREVCVSLAFNTDDGLLYGINRNDDFVQINPATGEQTVVMPTGLRTRYAIAGMVYLPESKKFILETLETDDTYAIAEIDLTTKTVTKLSYFDNFEHFPFFYMTDATADPAPIRAPELDEAKFDHAVGTAKISYFIPTVYFAGGTVSGDMKWCALFDGEKYSEGSTTAGDIVTVEFTGIEPGEHEFGFFVEQDGKKSTVNMMSRFVGYDVPNTPADVTLGESRIEWTPVTRCVNNGYLDVASLVYHVYVNGEEVGTTAESFLDYTLPVDMPYASYVATVVADNMGCLSAPGRSESVRVGKPWEPDFEIIPTPADAYVCSVFDLNQDRDYWEYYEDDDNPGTGYFAGPRGNGVASNDWLFMPPMLLDDSAVTYEISYEMGNFSSWYPEMEVGVYLHSELDPRVVSTTIREKSAVNNTKQFEVYTQRFAISDPGVYYLSFFTDAEPYQTGIRVRNIKVSKLHAATELPSEVTDLNVVGAPKGELKALVDFNMPVTYITGEKIPDSTVVDVRVTLGEAELSASAAPGEHVSVELPSQQGFNRVTVITSVGGMTGQESVVDVFTGIDVPGPVSSIDGYVSEDNLSLVARWTAPTEGENGYYIDPDDVVYNLMEYGEDGWEIVEVLGKNVFEYTYTVPAGTPLATARLGIAASTVAGLCSTVGWLTDVLGTPYDIPVLEEFKDASFKYGPIRIIRLDDDYVDSDWGVVNPRLIDPTMEVPSEVSCYGRSEGPSQRGMLMLPKFNLEGVTDPGIIFNCWTGANAADVTVYGVTFESNDFIEIGKFPLNGSGWQTVEMPFPDKCVGKKWVAIYIDAYFPTEHHYALFSSYEVRGGVSGIQNVEAEGGWVRPAYGEIIAEGLAGKPVAVYALDGRTVWMTDAIASDRLSIPVTSGIYIVRVGNTSLKVIVK
ncbi:MAG: T9SS type A sorting domain-containing protein [Muribaculaceae bacterium]|nr:T9SS type A sorting domain-containing protein [Muribaculaceae bacterium]